MSGRHEPVGQFSTLSGEGLGKILRDSQLLEPAQVGELPRLLAQFPHPQALASELVRRGWLTSYQVEQLFLGRGRELVLGAYVLLDRLGEGGMGEVYKARHQRLGRIVALKVIRKECLTSTEMVRRFHREVRAAAQLSHPHIVLAFDADQIGATHFLVMEYCEGVDLGSLLHKSGPLPIRQACEYIRQAALGLQHAHERGMVHRDIKPSNLLLTGGGSTVKVLDMGLARLQQPADEHSSTGPLTHEGMVMGTLDYMAPEQATDSHAVDIRADLYSLGCTLYHLLTGQVPFPKGSPMQKLYRHHSEEPQAVEQLRPEVPPALAGVVCKLMAKRPEDRYQTPAEVATALASWTGKEVVSPASGMPTALAADVSDTPEKAVGMAPAAGEPETVAGDIPVATVARGEKRPVRETRDTAMGFSSMVSPPVTEDASARHRQRQAAEKRRRLMLSVACAVMLVAALGLFLALLFRSATEQSDAEPEPEPSLRAKAKKVDEKAAAFDAWTKSLAALPAEKQVEAVAKKLQEINPGFDGKVTSKIENGVVTKLRFLTDDVTDISPVRVLSRLKRLECFGDDPNKRRLSDLRPLKGMALTFLLCYRSKVADLSPLTGMPLTYLDLQETQVSDLSPLKGVPLTYLSCMSTLVKDLSPLKGMPLTTLNCQETKVSDLSPLKSMHLTILDCNFTQVSDLSPLKGMPLTHLGCGGTKVSDLSPLKGMQLQELHAWGTAISDLSPLKGMPLASLMCHGTNVTDLSPLKGLPLKGLVCDFKVYRDTETLRSIKTLQRINDKPAADFWNEVDAKRTAFNTWAKPVTGLSPEKQVEAVAAKLKELNPGFDGKGTHKIENGVVVELGFVADEVTDIAPIRALIGLKGLSCCGSAYGKSKLSDLSPLTGIPLKGLWCYATKVADLSPLKGMALTTLHCQGTRVADLSPLIDMPLITLRCDFTRVANLLPLKGMKLTDLNCGVTKISDLSPLKGMPLTFLNCQRTKVGDLSPLKDLPLKELWCDFKPERDAAILRAIKTLETINGKAVAEFWKEVDKQAPKNLKVRNSICLRKILRMERQQSSPGEERKDAGSQNSHVLPFHQDHSFGQCRGQLPLEGQEILVRGPNRRGIYGEVGVAVQFSGLLRPPEVPNAPP